jgi:lipoate-protein ligase A
MKTRRESHRPFKVSGAAYRLRGDRAIHHGTMLVDVDMGALGSLLTPAAKKLASKGIASVRSRVCNLTEVGAQHAHVTTDHVAEALVAAFAAEYGPVEGDAVLTEADARADPRIGDEAQRLVDWTWAIGETPAFTLHAEERFAWATFDVHLEVAKGRIAEVVVFSDTLAPDFVDVAQGVLRGVRYDEAEVARALREINPSTVGLEAAQIDEFATWLAGEVA